MVVYHARRVIDSQTNLILAFTGLGPSEPNLVFSELASNVWDDLPHVQSLPSSIVSSIKFIQMGQRLKTAHPLKTLKVPYPQLYKITSNLAQRSVTAIEI